jgi:hypothetical protein
MSPRFPYHFEKLSPENRFPHSPVLAQAMRRYLLKAIIQKTVDQDHWRRETWLDERNPKRYANNCHKPADCGLFAPAGSGPAPSADKQDERPAAGQVIGLGPVQ